MNKSISFHKSNFGQFGTSLPCDLDGYVHTSIAGWMRAPMDGHVTRDDARDLVARTRAAVRQAKKALGEWQEQNA